MKKRLLSLTLALALLCALFVPAHAESFNPATRECVAVVYTCLELVNAPEYFLGWGTGFFVGETGKDPSHLITNHHVIERFVKFGAGELYGYTPVWNDTIKDYDWYIYENPNDSRAQYQGRSKIRVFYDSGTYEEAYTVEYSESKDVAVLKLAGTTSLRKPIPLAVPDDSAVGSVVFAVGYPGLSENLFAGATTSWGISDVTVTRGAVSRLLTTQGTGQAIVQIDCDIKHGNSGGPLVNAAGQAIGITTKSVSNTSGEQTNYAVNISEAITLLNRNGVVYATGGGTTAPATEPPASEPPAETQAPEPTQAPATEPPAETDPPTETEPPADPEPAKSNTGLIIGVGVAVVAVIAVVVVLLTRKKPTPVTPPPVNPGPSSPSFAPTEPPRGAIPAGGAVEAWRLQCQSGAFAGRRFAINGQLRVGRDPARNDLVYPSSTQGISGAHCVLRLQGGTLWLEDLGSSYGTFLASGQKLTPHQPVQLRKGDSFYLASQRELFQITGKGGV